jgi:hypothetical protein
MYEVKFGSGGDSENASALALALVSAITQDDQRRSEALFAMSEKRAAWLTSESVKFLATAEFHARTLEASPDLEWSGAVGLLAKTVENEIFVRVLQPLGKRCAHEDLSADLNDKDFVRVAQFCSDPNRKPPELGTFAHFLRTAVNSERRRTTSRLISAFMDLVAQWPEAQWLLDGRGFHRELSSLIFHRNRAAHTDELSQCDYSVCRDQVLGESGLLWRLILATSPHGNLQSSSEQ